MKKFILFFLLLLGEIGFLMVSNYQSAQAQDIPPTPQAPGMLSPMDLMEPPPLGENPDQADYGAQVYYYVCMACHGDRGQGLTEQWMEEWNLGKNSCWQSRCHAANHPPEGFKLPHNIPGIVGPVLTERFYNGHDLHDYIKKNMPWHAPGTLKEEEYWQLTAFLLRTNGFWQEQSQIDETNATGFVIRMQQPTPTPIYLSIRKSASPVPVFSSAYSEKIILVATIISIVILLLGLLFSLRTGKK